MRFPTIAVLVLAGLFPACAPAEEPLAELLAQLDHDDIAVRAAAEKKLMDAGAGALEPCRAALAAAGDEETRDRLGRVVAWLEIDARSPVLAAAWKDRWLIVTRNGKHVGYEHGTAEECRAGGRRAWKFVNDARLQEEDMPPARLRTELVAFHDAAMTPVECFVDLDGVSDRHRLRWKFDGVEFTLEILEARRGRYAGVRKRLRDGEVRLPGTGPYTLDLSLSVLLERASIARLQDAEFQVFPATDPRVRKCMVYRATFAGEEEVEAAGKRFKARRYVFEGGERRPREEWWFDDGAGVVKFVSAGYEVLLSGREAATAGFVEPEAAAAAQFAKELSDVAGDVAGRDEAELALLARDARDLAACRKALEAAPDDDSRARLGRVCNWLDPEFRRAEVAGIWKEAWFVAREPADRDAWVGSEHVTGEACEIGGLPAWRARHHVEFLGWKDSLRQLDCESRSFVGPGLRPVDVALTDRSSPRAVTQRFTCFEEVLTCRYIFPGVPVDEEQDEEATEIPNADGRPWTLGSDLTRLLERASLARLPALDVRSVDMVAKSYPGYEIERRRFRCAGEEEFTFGGKPATVRRYVRVGSKVRREEYLIEDARGLLVAFIGELRYERTDEEGASRK